MAKILVFGIVAMILGCSVHRPDMNTTMLVTIRQRSDAERECSDLLDRSTRACSIRYTPQGCTIIISHDDAGNAEVLGHEFRHCLAGDYH